jgi:hypothetical protein
MIKYRYILGNSSIETLNLNDIPQGLLYETIDFDEVAEETPIVEQTNEIIIGLLTKQVEVMTEEEKTSNKIKRIALKNGISSEQAQKALEILGLIYFNCNF